MRAARLYYPLGEAPLPVCLEASRGAHLLYHACDSSSYHPVSARDLSHIRSESTVPHIASSRCYYPGDVFSSCRAYSCARKNRESVPRWGV